MAKQEKNQQAQTEHSQAGAVIEMLTERGYLGNQEINDAKLRDARQEKQKAAYHNTLMLLKQYRNIAWMLECFPDTIAEELEQPFTNLDELIDRVDVEMAMDNRKLEGRMESIRKSRLLMDRVSEALTVLRKKPGNGEKMYKLIHLAYIAPEQLTLNEKLFRLNLSSRQYYRLHDQAVNILSLRLWAAPSKGLDSWLELLTLLENLH